jgi:hypothetical protein
MVMAIVETGVIGISLDDGETGVCWRVCYIYNVFAFIPIMIGTSFYNSFGVVNHDQEVFFSWVGNCKLLSRVESRAMPYASFGRKTLMLGLDDKRRPTISNLY